MPNPIGTKLHQRQQAFGALAQAVRVHAETPLGAEALTWGYRAKALSDDRYLDFKGAFPTNDRISAELNGAETSHPFLELLRELHGRGPGHLDDKEVMGIFGARDLGAFIREKRAEVEAKVGGDFEKDFLER